MMTSLLSDAFDHHVWATVRLIDVCRDLSAAQLETDVPGTYGSIVQTLRHLVGADSWYLFDITGDEARRIDEEHMDLVDLSAVMEDDGEAWRQLLAGDPDPEQVRREVDEADGFQRDAPLGIRLAQAIHHGTDHRSQVFTALTGLGIEHPDLDVWVFGARDGRVVDHPPEG